MIDIKGIDYLVIDRVLSRGTGDILEASEDHLFVYDHVSQAHLLACGDPRMGVSVLDRFADRDPRLLMVTDPDLAEIIFEKYGYSEKLKCYQAAWYGGVPETDPGLTVRTADKSDIPLLTSVYHLISPAEMEAVVDRRNLLLGYAGGDPVGFIGEHLEGSIGMLYVFPEFRRRGYAAALEKISIAKTVEKGLIPFGQVETDNLASLALQKKIGMTISEKPQWWMWK